MTRIHVTGIRDIASTTYFRKSRFSRWVWARGLSNFGDGLI